MKYSKKKNTLNFFFVKTTPTVNKKKSFCSSLLFTSFKSKGSTIKFRVLFHLQIKRNGGKKKKIYICEAINLENTNLEMIYDLC